MPELKTNQKVVEHLLGNGLKVLTKEVHVAPVASCYIWYKVGSRNERPGITGISHWVEHMLFKGTPSLPKEELKRVIERNGGQWNGFTYLDYTAYFENLPSEKVELALRLEADRMQNSIFDKDEVEAERTVILSEREGAENYPQFLLEEEVLAAAYKAHPYCWGVIGWKSDLQSITRDDLYDYYKAYYSPNNAILVLVGDFSTEGILKKVREYFEQIPTGKPISNPTTVEPEQLGERRVMVRKEGNVAHVYIAYHIPAVGNDDIYALDVLGKVLSSGRSSRLYRALVDKQLATYASFHPEASKDPGLAWLNAEARADVKPEKVEEALLAEIEKVQSKFITDSELARAINQTEAQFVYAQDGVSNQASRLGYYESLISHKYLDAYLSNIHKVSKEAIQNVARKYLITDNRTVGYFLPIPPKGTQKASETPITQNKKYYKSGADERGALTSLDKPSRKVLENGLVVIVQENHAVPAVSISGRIKAGGLYDVPELAGCADFVANMLLKGTKTRTWEQIAEEIDSVGASIYVGGGMETSIFNTRFLKKDFDKIISVLADIIRNPNFPEEEIEKHRNQIHSWFKSWDDNPFRVADRELRALIYPEEHPYHRRIQGYEETISKLGQDELAILHNRYYRPDTTIMSVVGGVTTEEVIDKIRGTFGNWEAEGETPSFAVSPVEIGEPDKKIIPMMDKSQVEVLLGHKGIRRTHTDFYAVDVMNRILGGSAGLGRLFSQVRDVQGLAYGVWSHFEASLGEGPFIAGAGVNPKNVQKAIQSILHEIRNLKDGGITEGELADAQEMIIGNFSLSMETNTGVANILVNVELYGLGLDYPEKHGQIYRSVTKEQVEESAQKYLHPDKCSLVTAGPYSAFE